MNGPSNETTNGAVPTITADDWLRGYFGILPEADRKGGSRVPLGKWKNVDFLRLRDVGLHLLDPRPGMHVLDIGCANGPTMIYCGLQGARVSGIDLDPEAVSWANRQLERFHVNGKAVVGDASRIPFDANQFDGVISSDFMEHVTYETKVAILQEARRVLKPGGVLVTKTPNLSYLQLSLLYRRLQAVARLKNPFELVIPHTPGTDDPQHIGLTTRSEFTRALIDAGFLNYSFHYAPLRRFGVSRAVEVLSTEIPVVRDYFCEDVLCRAFKPIVMSHFPD